MSASTQSLLLLRTAKLGTCLLAMTDHVWKLPTSVHWLGLLRVGRLLQHRRIENVLLLLRLSRFRLLENNICLGVDHNA